MSVASNWTAHQVLLRRSESQKDISLMRQAPGRAGISRGAFCYCQQATDGIDTVFHFAAVFRKEVPRRQIWATNVDGVDNLLSASVASGVRHLLHCSSTSVYGLSPQTPTTERSPFVPIPADLYQESKLEAENRVRSYADTGKISTTIFRTTGVYGPGD